MNLIVKKNIFLLKNFDNKRIVDGIHQNQIRMLISIKILSSK